jgi:hypothetical protein
VVRTCSISSILRLVTLLMISTILALSSLNWELRSAYRSRSSSSFLLSFCAAASDSCFSLCRTAHLSSHSFSVAAYTHPDQE